MRKFKHSSLLAIMLLVVLVAPISAATLSLGTNHPISYSPGDTLILSGSILPTYDRGILSDIYVAVVFPNGSIQTLDENFVWHDTLVPILSAFRLAKLDAPNFYSVQLTSALPSGLYILYLVAVPTGANPFDTSTWLGSARAVIAFNNYNITLVCSDPSCVVTCIVGKTCP
ncbi:MAG: hypothetical protein DM484_20770 [Candidatus Methylumidiphilus alinenensis]|uniref:Uncharacterized protein n=1 Tax=Candidatus Methylumidiphilus alinenensis TaxID=2202197 RepID=A0A2W4QRW9_9GAMM|nr:MAG: hypothetical protein DM484_20770 [Candidatus Methylumidiphilus alinenensis]